MAIANRIPVGTLKVANTSNVKEMKNGRPMNVKLEGADVVVIGRSNIVGKPMLQMLLKRNATVTCCHSYTKNIAVTKKT